VPCEVSVGAGKQDAEDLWLGVREAGNWKGERSVKLMPRQMSVRMRGQVLLTVGQDDRKAWSQSWPSKYSGTAG
jgi:hypothetical protein